MHCTKCNGYGKCRTGAAAVAVLFQFVPSTARDISQQPEGDQWQRQAICGSVRQSADTWLVLVSVIRQTLLQQY